MQRCWDEIPKHYKGVLIDAFVAMPNHVHGILVLDGPHVYVPDSAEFVDYGSATLGNVVGSFKSAVTRTCHAAGDTQFKWQARFHRSNFVG